jgi:hypothetical protein
MEKKTDSMKLTRREGTKYGFNIDDDTTSQDIFMYFVLRGFVTDNRFAMFMNSKTAEMLRKNDEKQMEENNQKARPAVFSVTVNNHLPDNTVYFRKAL